MQQSLSEFRPNPINSRGPVITDGELVERVRTGDPVAFELIMRRYNQRLYRLVRSMLRNESEAEDVVQETYVRAYAKLGGFNGPHGFSAWLCRIATNEALGRLRQRGRVISFEHYVGAGNRAGPDRHIDTMADQQPGPERLAASGELRRLLEDTIDALPEEFRTVFVMRAVEGLTVAETAASLVILPQTVKTRFHRARRLLQRALGERIAGTTASAFEFGGARCNRIVAAVLRRLDASLATACYGTAGP